MQKHANVEILVEIKISCYLNETLMNIVTKHQIDHHLTHKVKLPEFQHNITLYSELNNLYLSKVILDSLR